VVVKVPLPAFPAASVPGSMFQREEEIARQLDHPYILKFLPLATGTRRPYLVTEFVPGITLADRLASSRPCRRSRHCPSPARFAKRWSTFTNGASFTTISAWQRDAVSGWNIRLIDFGLAHTAITAASPCPAEYRR